MPPSFSRNRRVAVGRYAVFCGAVTVVLLAYFAPFGEFGPLPYLIYGAACLAVGLLLGVRAWPLALFVSATVILAFPWAFPPAALPGDAAEGPDLPGLLQPDPPNPGCGSCAPCARPGRSHSGKRTALRRRGRSCCMVRRRRAPPHHTSPPEPMGGGIARQAEPELQGETVVRLGPGGAGANADREGVARLVHWSNGRLPHPNANRPSRPNPLAMLDEAARGAARRCVEYSVVRWVIHGPEAFYRPPARPAAFD